MSYTAILTAFEAGELEPMSAFELAECHSLIELYELAADEADKVKQRQHPGLVELRQYLA